MTIRFEPRDIWVGLFWDREGKRTHFYVCLIPCVVIHFYRLNKAARQERTEYMAAVDVELDSRLDRYDRWAQ